MKTLKTLAFMLIILYPFSNIKGEIKSENFVELKDTSSNYLNGTYEGQSRAKYTGEPFWGHIKISLENGSFTGIQFFIRDSSIHESVDSMYGVRHYSGNATYMQQSVNDGHGIEIYPQRLLEKQDLDKVDAITGATWSYNIFKASAIEALKNATDVKENIDINEFNIHVLPNPFNSTLNIDYSITKKCQVNLSFYDLQGKLIKNLVNQEQQAGKYSYNWTDCPEAGIYFYHLKIDDKELTGKLLKLK